ncbi:MAG: hypothetical protein EXS09_15640 [Gemmataceae bacterium]|nr:hypothetical protein [Gemmataceae bacterium]
MWFLSLFTVVGSGLLLGLSFFPGLLEQVPRKYSFAIGGLYIGFALAITLRHLFQARAEGIRRQRIAACLVLLSLVLTPLVLASHIPRRLLFQQYQGDFEALLPDAPPPADASTVPLNADFALYWVDHWGSDRRGGVYFRTLATGQKGSKSGSYGFAHRPNADGSPFGDEDYEIHHLMGDWYTFSSSDK